MTYYTSGLPNGTFSDKKYQFDIQDKFLYIPGNYVGRDQMGDVHHEEQRAWLNSLAPGISVKEVWYGSWEFATFEDLAQFMKLLEQKG